MKVELAHDILAQKVYEKVSSEDKHTREVERLIKDRFVFYQGEPKLSAEEVDYIRPYLNKVHITEEEREFVQQSWRRQTAQRVRRLLIWAIVLLLFLILLGGGIFLRQTIQHSREIQAAKERLDSINRELATTNLALDSAKQVAEANAELAELQADTARMNANKAKREADRANREADRAEEEALRAEEEAERAKDNEKKAREARAFAEQKRQEADSLRRIAEEKARAVNLLIAQQLAEQSLKVSTDVRLKALLAREGYRIYQCFRVNKESDQEYAGRYNTAIYQAVYGALPDSLRITNQYTTLDSGDAASQVRTLLVQGNTLYSLTTNGRTRKWAWNASTVSLSPLESFQQEDPSGIYYALALPEGVPGGLALNDKSGAELVLHPDSLPSMQRWVSAHKVQLVGYDLPDQARLIVTSDSIFSWQSEDPVPVPLCALPTVGRWRSVAQHANGNLFAGVDGTGTLYYWRLGAQGRVEALTLHALNATVLAFHPQKDILAYGTKRGIVEMIHVSDPSHRIEILRGHKAGVTDISFNKKGDFLASSSRDRSVQLWHLSDSSYQRNGALRLDQEQGMVLSLAFSPDDNALLAGDADGIIRVWPLDIAFWFDKLTETLPPGAKLNPQERFRFISTDRDFVSQGLNKCLDEYEVSTSSQ